MHAACIVTYRGAPGSDRRANLDAVLAWLARTPDLSLLEEGAIPAVQRLELPGAEEEGEDSDEG